MENLEFKHLKEQNAKMEEQISLLLRAVDQNKLAKLVNVKDMPPIIKITMVNGHIVSKWENIKDFVDPEISARGDQVMRVTYITKANPIEEKSVEMSYTDFYKLEKKDFEVEETGTDRAGKVWYTFKYKDDAYKIEQTFIN